MTDLSISELIPRSLYESAIKKKEIENIKDNESIAAVFKSPEEIFNLQEYKELLTNVNIFQSKIMEYTNQLLNTMNNEHSKPILGENRESITLPQPLDIAKKIIKEENLYPEKTIDELRNDKDVVITIRNMLENKNIALNNQLEEKITSVKWLSNIDEIHDIANEQEELIDQIKKNNSSILWLRALLPVLNNYIRSRIK